jgi:superfamily II DNA helicase RecQ
MDSHMKEMSIKYGGVWQNYYDQLAMLRKDKEMAENSCLSLISENTILKLKNEENESNMKRVLLSLTESSNSNCQYSEILQQIKNEKESLLSKLLAYECQDEYCRKQIHMLEANLQYWQQKNSENDKKNQELMKELEKKDEIIRSHDRDHQLKNEKLQLLTEELKEKIEKITILNHSITSKDRFIKSLIHEKNDLKEEMQTVLANRKDRRNGNSSNNSEPASSSPRASSPRPSSSSSNNPPIQSKSQLLKSSSFRLTEKPPAVIPSKVLLSSRSLDQRTDAATPTRVADVHEIVSPVTKTPMIRNMTPFKKEEDEVEINPWGKPVMSSSLRHNYRKASTPTQIELRRRKPTIL